MVLDFTDKMGIAMVRNTYGAPKVADLIEAIDARYGTQPGMKQVNETFGALAKSDPAQLKKLNAVLENNPGLADKIKARAGQDPQGFSKSFLPAVYKNPESAVALVGQPAQVAQKPAAPITKTYGDYPEPGPIAAATAAAVPKPQPGQVSPTQTAQADAPRVKTPPSRETETETRLAAKMDQLMKVPGYNDLMDRVSKNPSLGDAVKAMMSANGSATEQEAAIDTVLAKTKEDPNLFKKLVTKIDQNPGAVSTFAGMVANDPKNALNMVSSLVDDDGPANGMFGMFGALLNGGKGGLSGMMNGLLGSLNGPGGGIMGMIVTAIMGLVTSLWGGGNHLVIGSNVGTTQYQEALVATNKKPDSVTVLGADGQTAPASTQVATATTTQDKAKTANGPQQLNQG